MLRVVVVAITLLASAVVMAVQDPLSAAKDLYASAAYEEALAALQVVRDRGESEFTRQAEEYRAFCLLALGRTVEAESAAEAAVRRDPLASIDPRDASPRVEAMFTSVRRRLLPALIRDAYRASRERMNHGDRGQGLQELERVRRMLDLAAALQLSDDALADLAVLVDGFLDLEKAQDAPKPSAGSSVKSPEAPATLASAATTAGGAPAASMPPRAITPVKIYAATDAGVVPPVVLRQDVPEVILDTASRKRSALIEVTIDERGGVRSVVIRESISEWIDEQLLKAARAWRYRPATRDGVAVPYLKVVGITIGGG